MKEITAPPLGTPVLCHSGIDNYLSREINGILSAVIKAGEKPDVAAITPLFQVKIDEHIIQCKEPIPKRVSKYDRWIVVRRPGRAYVFTLDKYFRLL